MVGFGPPPIVIFPPLLVMLLPVFMTIEPPPNAVSASRMVLSLPVVDEMATLLSMVMSVPAARVRVASLPAVLLMLAATSMLPLAVRSTLVPPLSAVLMSVLSTLPPPPPAVQLGRCRNWSWRCR